MTHLFHIRYNNTQGTLMRILMAASRRGLPMPYVQAMPVDGAHEARLLLDVSDKQVAQLYRDWHGTVDVLDVRSMQAAEEGWNAGIETNAPMPPASTRIDEQSRSAMA
jgi:acetolactate synthase small subunit